MKSDDVIWIFYHRIPRADFFMGYVLKRNAQAVHGVLTILDISAVFVPYHEHASLSGILKKDEGYC